MTGLTFSTTKMAYIFCLFHPLNSSCIQPELGRELPGKIKNTQLQIGKRSQGLADWQVFCRESKSFPSRRGHGRNMSCGFCDHMSWSIAEELPAWGSNYLWLFRLLLMRLILAYLRYFPYRKYKHFITILCRYLWYGAFLAFLVLSAL